MPEILLRTAVQEDVPAILGIWQEASVQAYPDIDTPPDLVRRYYSEDTTTGPCVADWQNTIAGRSPGVLTVAAVANTVVGYCAYGPGSVHDLYVAPAWQCGRRKKGLVTGIGSLLLGLAVREYGTKDILLWVVEGTAEDFYGKFDFSPTESSAQTHPAAFAYGLKAPQIELRRIGRPIE
jgi:hypothetical protein